MRYLLCYSSYENEFSIDEWVNTWVRNLNAAGINVKPFCLTINPPGPCLLWSDLDQRWKKKDRELMELYSRLEEALSDRDVLVNWNGINLHPEYLQTLEVFKVYGCFDDPESSEVLSRPVASSYDLCMVGNAAEVETYRRWGVKEARFWPLGYRHNDIDPTLTKEKILTRARSNDIMLCCERVSPHRQARLDKFSAQFPQGAYYGRGWPNGFLAECDRVPLMQMTKIGINIHNSTGPINFRSYYLPANGVLQICDNKKHLGMLYELNKEVVGYDSIEEAIDLCRYYLEHEEERLRIAVAGFERATRDYNEVAVFKILIREVEKLLHLKSNSVREVLNKHVAIVDNAMRNGELRLAEQSAEELVRMVPDELIAHFTLMDIRMAMNEVDAVRNAYLGIPNELRTQSVYVEEIGKYESWLANYLKEVWLPNAALLSSETFKSDMPTAYSILNDAYQSNEVAVTKAEAFLDPFLKILVVDSIDDLKRVYQLGESSELISQLLSNRLVPSDNVALINEVTEVEAVYQQSSELWKKLSSGGFLLWLGFSPMLRGTSDAINSVMMGATAFLISQKLNLEVIHLRNSTLGVLRKPYS